MKKNILNNKITILGVLGMVITFSTGCQITRERSAQDLATRTANYELKRLQHNFDNYRIEQSNEAKLLNEQIIELNTQLATAQEQIRYIKQYLIDINNGVKPKDFDNLPATTIEPQLKDVKVNQNTNDDTVSEENTTTNQGMSKESTNTTNLRLKSVNSDEYYIHTVESGETLTSISKQYAISIRDIKDANRLDNTDRIFVGQKLYIPKK